MSYDFQCPDFGPWVDGQKSVWVIIKAFKYSGTQAAMARTATDLRSGGPVKQYKLLLPQDFQFNLDHVWDTYENISSRLANAISTAGQVAADAGGAWSTVKNVFTDFKFGNPQASMEKAIGGFLGINVYNYRIDTSLVYKNTQNLEYVFNFELAAKRPRSNFQIHRFVNDLLGLSSPSILPGAQVGITPPHIFSISTEPIGFFGIENAALKSIQPVFSEFTTDGPMKCALTLTFMDLRPVFEDITFKQTGTTGAGGIGPITVNGQS